MTDASIYDSVKPDTNETDLEVILDTFIPFIY